MTINSSCERIGRYLNFIFLVNMLILLVVSKSWGQNEWICVLAHSLYGIVYKVLKYHNFLLYGIT